MIAELILTVAVAYLLLGVLFLFPFLYKGLSRIDEGSKNSSIGFKAIITPGIIVFWPVLLKKWLKHRVS